MFGDGKSTVVDRPGSVPSQDRAEPAPPRRESRRRSVPPGSRYESGDEIGRGGMGRVVEATDTLLGRKAKMGELRGEVHDYHGIKVIVTYHPAALLRNPQWKRPTWEDVQQLRRLYDESHAAGA